MEEIRRLIGEMEFVHPVTFVEGKYEPERFYEMAKGLEKEPEGGERCFGCYRLRMEEAARLAADVTFVEGKYEPERFYEMAKGLEKEPEGGERCFGCYRLRMEEAARLAAEGEYDYFTTTLSISPLKNAGKINEIGEELAGIYKVEHLPSDFKKKNGYKRSIELSREHDLYRQNYCGCVFSRP